ncbi:hypothetical protein O181_016241 [Austropuccinia psidii MF-1]|uniref:F-BAR domain-containing protein n=1 Tax=Austropuccinia psidii MF-1 TaxID=1389203 RepID=A0A9Q3C585_9BASI|nr:hypothetical protein [Austropuccinia psidii MF-1]
MPEADSPQSSDWHNPRHTTESNEFCNSFWGEDGYEIILGKSKLSNRILGELKAWYKERAALEADYAKRLQKLSKANIFNLMRYESEGLRNGFEKIREITAQSAHSHAELSGTFKTGLEGKLDGFISKREGVRKNPQASIEKLHKRVVELKILQEKARRRFEADSIAVNGYGAQLHLVQGREMDKISAKLDKAQGSIGITEKEYRVLTKNLQESSEEWNLQWKSFCDLMQDLEEDRIDFIRSSLWDYVNGISTICILEDEQCEKARQVLERCDTVQDIKKFIRHASTGRELDCAPSFIDYTRGEHESLSYLQSKNSRAPCAKFTRNSCRDGLTPKLETPSLIQDLATSVTAGPAKPPPEPVPEPSLTVHQAKKQLKRGGNIAEVIASYSLPTPSPVPAMRVHLQPAANLSPSGSHNPHHHNSFYGAGILVNNHHRLPQHIFDRPLPPHPSTPCVHAS